MSLRAILWAFDQDIFPSSHKFVLVALANFASDTGKSYPGVSSICSITSLQDETVRNALTRLTADNVIIDTGLRTGNTNQVKVYQLPESVCERPRKTGAFKDPTKTLERPGKDPVKTPERPGKDPVKTPENMPPTIGTLTRTETGTGKRKSATQPKLTDDEWMTELKSNPAYEGIDLDREHSKMKAWCQVNHRLPTRRTFINWINRCDRPMKINGVKTTNRPDYSQGF